MDNSSEYIQRVNCRLAIQRISDSPTKMVELTSYHRRGLSLTENSLRQSRRRYFVMGTGSCKRVGY